MKTYHSPIDWKRDDPMTIITYGDLSFCLEYRLVEIKGQEIKLTVKEFDLLALLILNPKHVFTFEMIIDLIWQENDDFYSRKTVSNHVSRLRQKLKASPTASKYIKSVHSIGYKFDAKE